VDIFPDPPDLVIYAKATRVFETAAGD